MSLLDSVLGQIAGLDVNAIAARVGLPPELVERGIQALGVAHPQPGDTVNTAAQTSGLPHGKLQEILAHLGGENALGQLSGMLGGGGLGGLAGGLFGQG